MDIKSVYIGLDFDGTMVKYKYPEVGDPIIGAIEAVHELMAAGHKIILHTMRNGERLAEAVEYLEDNGIKLYAVNENPSQKYWAKDSRKIFCNYYIDDASIGCPLVIPDTGRPHVDWDVMREMLYEKGLI